MSTWNFKPLFKNPSQAALRAELKRARAASRRFAAHWQKRTDYLAEPKTLARALADYETLSAQTGGSGAAGYYIQLRTAQDQNDSRLKAWVNQIEAVESAVSNELQFFTLRLSRVAPATQKKFLIHPALAPYRYFLTRLFATAKYDLTEAEEKIMTLKGPLVHGNWVRMVESFIAQEERAGKSFSVLASELSSAERSTRQQAAAYLEEIFVKYLPVAEHELNAILQNKKINDELRGFKRPDAARHVGEDVDSKIIDVLLQTVTARFALARRYYAFKAKLLGLPDFQYYDRGATLPNLDKKYSLAEGKKMVARALGKLDPEFAEIFERFFAQGLVDIYPRVNKDNGAFCAHNLPRFPTYILLNYQDRLRDVTTLAHEVGHGINNELVKQKQPALYFGTPVATAEVASTFMEDFALAEIATDLAPDERLALQVSKLDDEMSAIFRQIACYRLEQDLHRRFRATGYLAAAEINARFKKHMTDYLGPAALGCDHWWVYWSHIRSFFYVYSYASGLLVSKALQARVRQNPKFISRIKEFLAAGSSDSPKNLFKKMGVDITKPAFWHQGLDEVEQLLNDTEALAKKLGRLA